MKKALVILFSLAVSTGALACDPNGWTLIKQGMLGIGETVCTYTKNGYQTSIVVSGFCPFNPCQR